MSEIAGHNSIEADELLRAAARGDKLIVLKGGMKYDGRIYHRGDEIELGGFPNDALLLAQGAFTTVKRWRVGGAFEAQKKYRRDKLDPARSLVNTTRSAEARLQAQIGPAENHLAALREQYAIARAAREKAEAELAELEENEPRLVKE